LSATTEPEAPEAADAAEATLLAADAAARATAATAAPMTITTAAPARRRRDRRGGRQSRQSLVLASIERRLGVTTVGLGVLGMTLLLWIGGRTINSRGLVLAAYGLAMVLLTAWVLGRRNLSVETDRSEIPSRVRAGRPVDVQITLTAKRRLSGIIIEERLDPHLGASVRVPVPVLPAGQSVAHQYGFSPTTRGIYKLGPLYAEWSDPFGLTRRRQQIAPTIDIIVHPNTETVLDRITSREWEDPPIRPPISKPWPTGFEFYGMREYVDGDDPRRIVWRAVARYDKYLVREAEQGITDRVNIYLDSDVSTHSSGQDSETFELAVSVAASLAAKHLKDGFSVCLDVNSGRLADAFRAQPKLIPLLDVLAGVKRESVSFTTALDRLFSDPRRSSHNIVITPHLSQEGAARLRLLLERGGSLLLVLALWDDTDPLTLHRAGGLGCNVVEVMANTPLQTLFSRVVSARR
jgi:uncharacterized protein (DUF58 family)